MSESINGRNTRETSRWLLLAGVSVAALLVVAGTNAACADDESRPTVWIELGGQLERTDGGQEPFAPPFISEIDGNEFTSPLIAQRPARYTTGFEGGVLFQPQSSDWVFSASVRYGRSNRNGKLHQEGPVETAKSIASIPLFSTYISNTKIADSRRYADTTFKENQSYAIIDFQVGKDVGLGLFGHHGTSMLSGGVRIAQFSSRSQVSIGGDFDFAFSYAYQTTFFGFPGYFKLPLEAWHLNHANAQIERSFRGIGPSIAWDMSTPIWGEASRGQLSLDFGVNGAVLFGRQKTNAVHQTAISYRSVDASVSAAPPITYQPGPRHASRTHSVVVPNVGGQIGLSFAFPDAKVAVGYRGDFFFGAMDGGIDTRKTYDRNFYGPFATVSIGLGG